MALMLAGLAAATWLGNVADPQRLFSSPDPSTIAPWAGAWLAAANAIALGLMLLLAGLRHVSLRTSARARHGTLVRMGAANLLLVCFVFTVLQDEGALDAVLTQWYLGVPLLIGFVLAARSGFVMFRSGWKYDARTADEALAADPRPPVLYLRSFEADPQILVTGPSRTAKIAGLLNYAASVSPEQELAFILGRVGPVIAIGKPGERLPELGAARRYVGDDEWREVVGQFMSDAALVVIRAGDTDNLWWEVEQAMTRCAPNRIIIVVLGPEGSLPAFERRFANAFSAPVQSPRPPLPRHMWLVRLMSPFGRSAGRILYFDESRTPHEEPLQFRMTWSGFVLVAFRPYRDSLQAAFRTVFANLGLRWTSERSLTIAVLLALFGGIFGLHHFYMGHVRRGFWYLGFFWIAVPMLLGWIDAARLALLDDAQFESRLNVRSSPADRRRSGFLQRAG
jgi:TM2 domain-containing membrane protein YozV